MSSDILEELKKLVRKAVQQTSKEMKDLEQRVKDLETAIRAQGMFNSRATECFNMITDRFLCEKEKEEDELVVCKNGEQVHLSPELQEQLETIFRQFAKENQDDTDDKPSETSSGMASPSSITLGLTFPSKPPLR